METCERKCVNSLVLIRGRQIIETYKKTCKVHNLDQDVIKNKEDGKVQKEQR
jgi:hypothetical protein